MKKILITIMALSILSCAQKNRLDLVFFAHTGEITSLDPVYSYDAVTHGTLLNIYETLIGFNGDSLDDYIPLISEKIPSQSNGLISKDDTAYTFPIRKNIYFHNGDILTAEDVRYSLLRFMIMDVSGGPSALFLEPVFGVTSIRNKNGNIAITKDEFLNAIKVDGDNVIIKLKKPFAPFLSIVARWSYVMDKKWAVESGEWDGSYETIKDFSNRTKDAARIIYKENGSGPYKVLKWEPNRKQITLQSFDKYWRGEAKVKTVVEKTIAEFSTRRLMIERGDADIIEVPRIYEEQLVNLKGVKLYSRLPRLMTDPVFFFTFDINTDGNPDIGSGKLDGEGIPPDFFKDINIRKAFACSFDYDRFIKESLKGEAERAYSPIPPSVLKIDGIKRYEFNTELAKEYFKKAYGGKVWQNGFKFTLTFNNGSDVRQLAAEILKKGIEGINPKFKIDIRGLDWAVYLEKAGSKKMPLFTRGWVGDYADPHNFIFPFYHSNGRYPVSQGFSNPELDRMIEYAATETDKRKRKEAYRKIIDIANENVYQIYTIHPYGIMAIRQSINGFVENPLNMGIYFYELSKSEAK
ncbi:MAG: ABC transporter substrate-binding protein [Elusimicrobia bacterium]|nr:ABC transporter substrate-binding protein [Elusimicrobiota bacterium]